MNANWCYKPLRWTLFSPIFHHFHRISQHVSKKKRLNGKKIFFSRWCADDAAVAEMMGQILSSNDKKCKKFASHFQLIMLHDNKQAKNQREWVKLVHCSGHKSYFHGNLSGISYIKGWFGNVSFSKKMNPFCMLVWSFLSKACNLRSSQNLNSTNGSVCADKKIHTNHKLFFTIKNFNVFVCMRVGRFIFA